jgi:hypothetical protein
MKTSWKLVLATAFVAALGLAAPRAEAAWEWSFGYPANTLVGFTTANNAHTITIAASWGTHVNRTATANNYQWTTHRSYRMCTRGGATSGAYGTIRSGSSVGQESRTTACPFGYTYGYGQGGIDH